MGRKFSNTVIVLILACAFAICLTNSGQAFDGKRKGFMIGAGAGFSPITYQGSPGAGVASYREENNGLDTVKIYVVLGPRYISRTRSSIAFQFDFGYGWDDQNVTFLRNQHAFFRSNSLVSQGISALCWSHYFGAGERTIYSTVGIGFYSMINWSRWRSTAGIDDGVSLLIGLGYEIKRHLSVELNFSQGPMNSGLGRCTNLVFGLNATAF